MDTDRSIIRAIHPRSTGQHSNPAYAYVSGFPDDDMSWLKQLPYTLSVPCLNCVAVHAGLAPHVPLDRYVPGQHLGQFATPAQKGSYPRAVCMVLSVCLVSRRGSLRDLVILMRDGVQFGSTSRTCCIYMCAACALIAASLTRTAKTKTT
jgi:hypothetical protein